METNQQDITLLKEFGVKNCGDTKMIEVETKLLSSPNIIYRSAKNEQTSITVKNASWVMRDNNILYNSKELTKWLIVWITDTNNEAENYMSILAKGIRETFNLKSGLIVSEPKLLFKPGSSIDQSILDSIQQQCSNPKLVVFIINKNEEREKIKYFIEKTNGLMTQCIKLDKFVAQTIDQRKLSMYLSNLVLKLNIKLGGMNNLVCSHFLE
jgi:hypothetical protein